MSKKRSLFGTLHLELLLAALMSLIAAVLFFWMAQYATSTILDQYFLNSDYLKQKSSETAELFQQYINEHQLTTKDTEAMKQWVSEQPSITAGVAVDGRMIFDSSQNVHNSYHEYELSDNMPWFHTYPLRFADAAATFYLLGFWDYQAYLYLYYLEMVLTLVVFGAVFTLMVLRKLQYVALLEHEVKILEGGNLDYIITVRGHDELTSVAESLNDLRISLKEQIAAEEEAWQANRELVTSLSHDLRTPLTTQIGYLEILKEGHWDTKEEHERYVDKCLQTCHQLKQMSDQLFTSALSQNNTENYLIGTMEYYDGLEIFLQFINEKMVLMEEAGYTFIFTAPEQSFTIRAEIDELGRIFNNIFSNLEKYADKTKPIQIQIALDQNSACIQFENEIDSHKKTRSVRTGIGLQNVRNLMARQHGTASVSHTEKGFLLQLVFPVI